MTLVPKDRTRNYVLIVVAVVALVGAAIALAWFWSARATSPTLCEALRGARVAKVWLAPQARLSCEGVATAEVAGLPLGAALQGSPEMQVAQLLAAEKAAAIGLVPGRGGRGVLGKLASFQHVPGLRGIVLSPELAVYAPFRELTLSAREADAVAYVARALFRGAREPSVSSFPVSLRKVERVEVIVTLSENGRPLLWRSTRGTSIARALLTATRVARDRWHESSQSKGGPLEKRLPSLDVEVGILSEDGTLASLSPSFIDQVITPGHGIGFDYRNGWHYLSPADVAVRGKGKPFAALQALLADQGLPPTTLKDPNLRVYRFVPLMLGVSKAPLGGATAGD
ncbi:MAG: hypothetical protein QM778_04115 [Myxococcales bacterium]